MKKFIEIISSDKITDAIFNILLIILIFTIIVLLVITIYTVLNYNR